jgi:hypothetical protein
MAKKIDIDSLKEKIIDKVEEIKGMDIWTSSVDIGSEDAMFAFVYRGYNYVVDIHENGKDKQRKLTKKQILALPNDNGIKILALRCDKRFKKERNKENED